MDGTDDTPKGYQNSADLATLWNAQPQIATIGNAGQLVNSTTPAALLTVSNLYNGVTYVIVGDILISQTAGAGAAVFTVAGTAGISSNRIVWDEFAGYSATAGAAGTPTQGLSGFTDNSHATYTSSVFGAVNPGEHIHFAGAVTASSSGTFTIQASCTIAADTYTVLYGSYMIAFTQF